MDTLIDKLTEIEKTAAGILDGADEEKHQLDEEQQKRIRDYDREADEKVDRRIAEIEASLSASKEQQLSKLREDSDRHLKAVVSYYENNSEKIADQIFGRIIRK